MNHQRKEKEYTSIKTFFATMVLLLFFFLQGAVVVINKIEGTESAVIRGGIIGLAAIVAIVFSLLKNKNLTSIGFHKPEQGASKQLLYYIPLVVIALSAWGGGIDFEKESGLILANLFLAINVVFAEEIYFRGIICNLWLEKSVKKAVIVSSILFGICHLMNVLGGASPVETSLQICFAFTYGIVFALIFIISKSIWPCILLHAFHDSCSFLSLEGSMQMNILIGMVQFFVLITYIAVILRKWGRE